MSQILLRRHVEMSFQGLTSQYRKWLVAICVGLSLFGAVHIVSSVDDGISASEALPSLATNAGGGHEGSTGSG